jgi:hypothetical protein
VSNLGLNRPDATHTTGKNPMLKQISKTQEMGEKKHAPFVVRHREADQYIFDYIIGGKKMKRNETLPGRLYKRLAVNYDRIRKLFQL